jgi:hypothetical protein
MKPLRLLPQQIKVFDITYSITYCDVLGDVNADPNDDTELWGFISHKSKQIRVYRGERPQDDVWKTLWHEILHAILERLNMDHAVDHGVIDLLAMGINTVLIDNDMGYLRG